MGWVGEGWGVCCVVKIHFSGHFWTGYVKRNTMMRSEANSGEKVISVKIAIFTQVRAFANFPFLAKIFLPQISVCMQSLKPEGTIIGKNQTENTCYQAIRLSVSPMGVGGGGVGGVLSGENSF